MSSKNIFRLALQQLLFQILRILPDEELILLAKKVIILDNDGLLSRERETLIDKDLKTKLNTYIERLEDA